MFRVINMEPYDPSYCPRCGTKANGNMKIVGDNTWECLDCGLLFQLSANMEVENG